MLEIDGLIEFLHRSCNVGELIWLWVFLIAFDMNAKIILSKPKSISTAELYRPKKHNCSAQVLVQHGQEIGRGNRYWC